MYELSILLLEHKTELRISGLENSSARSELVMQEPNRAQMRGGFQASVAPGLPLAGRLLRLRLRL
jgi:hypothetical protein